MRLNFDKPGVGAVARLVGVALALLMIDVRSALAIPPNFVDQPVVSGWNQAVGVTFTADGHGYVWEKGGRVWLLHPGEVTPELLIDISEEVGDWRDYGLLGFALDPDFENNGYIYLLYCVDFHHLWYFGTPQYDPGADEYFRDTIGRLTRYTCDPATNFHSVIPASRTVLIGETASTGFPLVHQSHGIGTLAFADDGTLIVGCGDGASYEEVDNGGPRSGSSNTALADGIITSKEDVGAFRAQLVDSLNGKMVRIDPATGDGVPTNPFYDPLEPRSARSRVWAMGFRNPFRFTIRPGSGSTDPSDGDPGTLYVGDVGWYTWEELNVVTGPGGNYGWPIYEGLTRFDPYYFASPANLDAPNPLFGSGGCTQQYFSFADLIVQDTLAAASFPNPCDPGQQIGLPAITFEHARAAIDWSHGFNQTRVPTYEGDDASECYIGEVGCVQGNTFNGFSSTGGAWYTGTTFPVEWQNMYYQSDFVDGWIKAFVFDAQDNLTEVKDFIDGAGFIVDLEYNPFDQSLYYINYDDQGGSSLRRIYWTDNAPPVAVATATPSFGPLPLPVQFDTTGTFDPEGLGLSYFWDFGDGTFSTEANPSHIFENLTDITAQGTIVARVYQLFPPGPQGGGNHDPEVIRDGDYPPVGNFDSSRQFDTFHFGDQNQDWIGYEFAQSRTFRRVVFQEGIHFGDGGWFDTLNVQVYKPQLLSWVNVTNLQIAPAYSFGDDGETYETYVLTFNASIGTGIRIAGQAGGSANFISVGELRVFEAAANTGIVNFFPTVTVTDPFNNFATVQLLVSGNNTPPQVQITSPVDGTLYQFPDTISVSLSATVSDAEHGPGQLQCAWQTILHHNDHTHPEPLDLACDTTSLLTPYGCNGETYFYEFRLTVTDEAGLSTAVSSFMYPDCNCPADANGDGLVNFADLNVVLTNWGQTVTPGESGDVNSSGTVDFEDLNIVLSSWEDICGQGE